MRSQLAILKEGQRWGQICVQTQELSSAAVDPDLTGVGSTPFVGDRSSTGVRVPAAPTTSQTNRYLIRLCGTEIATGQRIVIRALRQLATIRYEEIQNGLPLVVEREITSPLWRFIDGNISWHLRFEQTGYSATRFTPGQGPGTAPDFRGLDSALIFTPPAPVPYRALNNGIPPGVAIDDLGTFRDIRFMWDDSNWGDLNHVVNGPGRVVFYASVDQTDPGEAPEFDRRPNYPDGNGLRPEDQFLSNFKGAIYGRVAGAIIFDEMSARPGAPMSEGTGG